MKRKLLYILMFGLIDVALEPLHAAFMETSITVKSVIEAFIEGCIFGALMFWIAKPAQKKAHVVNENSEDKM